MPEHSFPIVAAKIIPSDILKIFIKKKKLPNVWKAGFSHTGKHDFKGCSQDCRFWYW